MIQGTTFTDPTIPKIYKDKWIDAATLFLFDLKNKYCTGEVTKLVNLAVLKNLVDDAPTAVCKLSAGELTLSGGGIYLPGPLNYIDLGSTYDLVALNNPSFVMMVWVMQDDNFSAQSYQGIIGRSLGGGTSIQYRIDTNGGGPWGGLMNNAAGTSLQLTATGNNARNVPTQLALSWESGVARLYVNGAQVGSGNIAAPSGATAANTWVGNMQGGTYNFKGKIYRWGMKLLSPGNSAASQVTADYAANMSRFS